MLSVANVDAKRQLKNSDPLHPHACIDITCADVSCKAPFELVTRPGQCCPICWAPDHKVGLDRHTSMSGPNPFAADPHPAAPTMCKGVKCFKPVCYDGFRPGHKEGQCCTGCV